MERVELFHPTIAVHVGEYTFASGVEIQIYSDVNSYFDWAKVRFTKEYQEKINIGKGDKVSIYLGYDTELQEVFRGYVVNGYNQGTGIDEIFLKDEMIRLEESSITNTFLDTLPQEMISYCLASSGIINFQISDTVYPVKKVVPVQQKNGVEVFQQINTLWKTDMQFFFDQGIFYWGLQPKQSKIYHFEYGKNIITLGKDGSLWYLETVSMPFIRHSHKIQVTHPKLSGVFKVGKVRFTTNESGFIRSQISFS